MTDTATKCTCVNVDMGSYANQEVRTLPFATERYPVVGTKMVGIDRCVLPDVEALWVHGVETIESCCGHGKATGYILVKPDGVHKMLSLGYQQSEDHAHLIGCFAWPRAQEACNAGR